MDNPCTCDRTRASERGTKIHRTKMGCLNTSFQQQRTKARFKTTESASQRNKFQMIDFLGVKAEMPWKYLDSKLVLKLDLLIETITLEHKLATFRDIVYQTCLDNFGA
ncbi:reverse transcriptase [Elysia marginata]|uniref:Reverse transcriptase n=1 Tax=Elysia marginata TaxID=1093978 RepID=A0AAV4EL46_9GAST|nr:reverse transcriptase [Elysia marginata]